MIKQYIVSDGSNSNNMIEFSNRYRGVVQVRLEENFRSTKAIVNVADTLIRNNQNRLSKKMFSSNNIDTSKVIVQKFAHEIIQYWAIAEEIVRQHEKGKKYKDIAILVRKGKYIKDITMVLNKMNIPFTADSAEYFFEGKYFNKFIETLKILTDFSKDCLYLCWKDSINDENFNQGYKYLRTIANGSAGDIKLSDILNKFLLYIDFLNEEFEDIDDRKNDLKGIMDILDDYDEVFMEYQLSGKIKGLIDFLSEEAAEQYKYHNFRVNEDDEDLVQILTVHKSKGLEYDTVFIPNLEMGEFPNKKINGKKYWHVLSTYFKDSKEKYESNIDDERKLFYVAMTRAKKSLNLFCQVSQNPLSIFLEEIYESNYIENK